MYGFFFLPWEKWKYTQPCGFVSSDSYIGGCYGLNMCEPQNSLCRSLTLNTRKASGRRSGHEGSALMFKLVPLGRRSEGVTRWRKHTKGAIYEEWTDHSPNIESSGLLILGFSASRIVSSKLLLLFKLPNLMNVERFGVRSSLEEGGEEKTR